MQAQHQLGIRNTNHK